MIMMSKTNYSKVENAFTDSLEKMKIEKIREIPNQSPEQSGQPHPAQKFVIVVQELKWLKKTDPDIHKNTKISKKEIATLADVIKRRRNSLTDKEVERIDELLKIVKEYKKTILKEVENETQVEKENDRHLYKRHNVSEKWIPLDVPRK